MVATIDQEVDIVCRDSGFSSVILAPMTSAQTSLLVESTWESGSSPARLNHGITSLAILSSTFTNRMVRVGIHDSPPNSPLSVELQTVSPRFLNQPKSRSDFNTYMQLKKDRNRLLWPLFPRANLLQRVAPIL